MSKEAQSSPASSLSEQHTTEWINSNNQNLRQVSKNTRFSKENQPAHRGRPKGFKRITDGLVHRLENEGKADSLAEVAVKLAEKGKPSQRIQALTFIADRTEGKPVQAHKIEHGIDNDTARLIAELANKLL